MTQLYRNDYANVIRVCGIKLKTEPNITDQIKRGAHKYGALSSPTTTNMSSLLSPLPETRLVVLHLTVGCRAAVN